MIETQRLEERILGGVRAALTKCGQCTGYREHTMFTVAMCRTLCLITPRQITN